MNLFLLIALIYLQAVQNINASCKEERQLESTCGSYCFKSIRPVLDHTKALQSQVDINNLKKKSESLAKLENIESLLQNSDTPDKLGLLENKFTLVVEKLMHWESENQKQKTEILSVKELTQTLLTELRTLQDKLTSFGKLNFQDIGVNEIEKVHFFLNVEERKNWFGAAHGCREMGGHLARIKSKEEFDFLTKKLTKNNYWIDINDLSKDRNFISLTTGKKPTFFHWDENEPNNWHNNGEHCVSLRKTNGYYAMNDEMCDKEYYYICQK